MQATQDRMRWESAVQQMHLLPGERLPVPCTQTAEAVFSEVGLGSPKSILYRRHLTLILDHRGVKPTVRRLNRLLARS